MNIWRSVYNTDDVLSKKLPVTFQESVANNNSLVMDARVLIVVRRNAVYNLSCQTNTDGAV